MGLPARDLLKSLIFKTCGPRAGQWLRRTYTIRKLTRGRYYREREMMLIRSLVRNGDYVADVGANVGVYTKELSLAVGPTGKVYSFEPVSQNYDILTTFATRGRLNNVYPFRAALGSRVSEDEMVIPDMEGFTGFYWAHLSRAGDKGRRELVNVLTLDDLVNRQVITRLDFIKCDVEGGELEVLRGGLALLAACRPAWLMEVSRDTSSEVFRLFHELGYQAYVYSDQLIRVDAYRDREFSNYFFLHRRSKSEGCFRHSAT